MKGFKEIIGYEGFYSVDQRGVVFSLRSGKELKPSLKGKGYASVELSCGGKRKQCYIHRLVAQTFIPNPNALPQINHKNGIKTDNRVENLEWCSVLHNLRHALDLGLRKPPAGDQHWTRRTKKLLNEVGVPDTRWVFTYRGQNS